MPLPKFSYAEVLDTYVRDNFKRLFDFLRLETQLMGFKHCEVVVTAADTIIFSHNLGFLPKDVIVTRNSGPGTVTWNYSDFTNSAVSLTVSGASVTETNPQTIRFFLGTYQPGAR